MEFKSFQETEIGMDKEKKPVVYTAAAVLTGCFVYAVQIRFPLWWLFAGALIGIVLFIRLAFFTRPKGRWSRTFMLVDPDLIWLRIDFARLEPIFWSNDARKHDFVYFLDPKGHGSIEKGIISSSCVPAGRKTSWNAVPGRSIPEGTGIWRWRTSP